MGTFLKDFGAKNHEKASQLGARGLERNRAGVSNRAEPAENRRAQRRHRLGRHTRNPASKSNGRLESGVDLFGRASRGLYRNPKNENFAENLAHTSGGGRSCGGNVHRKPARC